VNLNNQLILGIRLSTLLLCAGVIATVAVLHVGLRWWSRRRSARMAAAVEGPGNARLRFWMSRALDACLPPAALVLWIHGGYFVLDLMLRGMSPSSFTLRALVVVDWAYGMAMVAAIFWLLVRAGHLAERFLTSLADRTGTTWDDVMLPLAGRAVGRLLPLLALILAAPLLRVSPTLEIIFRNGASLVLIGVVAWLVYQAIDAVAALILRQHRIDVSDNLHARAVHTQVMVLRKAAITIIVVFTVASMLMVFDSVRQFGASILASAGIAGIIIGFAAQQSIATLLAGFQIAMTQPIRVDDVVIVENEWGRIEDITLTYVVVRIWDLRRLVLPITYFIEKPFQNWTRTESNILGTVFLQVDYTVPLEALRVELTRILDASPRWDRRVNGLQVTEARERTLEIRALMSAADASLAWDLRCEVREKLVDFLQRNYPGSLPKLRGSLDSPLPQMA
jgi:small-conductance mechanosensitive channel